MLNVPRPWQRFRRWSEVSLARQLLLLQAAIVLMVCVIAAGVALFDARRDADHDATAKALAVAGTVARSPLVVTALRTGAAPSSSSPVQQFAEGVRQDTATDFVVVMRLDRTRLSHPNPARIGEHFVGHIHPAVAGRPFTETYTGTLGPSVRAVVPVRSGGRVIGLVSVGITVEKIGQDYLRQLPPILAVAALAFAVAALGTFAVSRRLRRQTHGLGPQQMTRMYEYWDAVLHSVKEGLLVLDRDGVVQLANDEAVRLLELPPDAVGRPVSGLLPESLRQVAEGGEDVVDELHLVGLHTLVVNQRPAIWEGHRLGTVITFRGRTELTALTGELDSVRGFAEALRAQTHEAANRLHTVVALVELGRTEAAVRLATDELRISQELTDRVMGAVAEPVLSALLLGKASQARERGVEFVITEDTAVGDEIAGESAIDPRDLVTLVGNLIDNAIEAALTSPPPRRVEVTAREDAGDLLLRVRDTGPGLDPADLPDLVHRGASSKGAGRGLGLALADQVVRRHHGSLVIRRADPGSDPGPGSSSGPGPGSSSGPGSGSGSGSGGTVFEARLPLAVAVS